MTVLPAHRVATPVLEQVTGGVRGTLLGAGATAAWVDLGGFVLAITTREAPLLPNAVALTAAAGTLARAGPGVAARCAPGRVELAGLMVTWDPAHPPAWDPTVPPAATQAPASAGAASSGGEAVAHRGAEILAALGLQSAQEPAALVRALASVGLATATEARGAAGLEQLLRAILHHDVGLAAEAAELLLGRGPGLTPEGDDLLAAVAATMTTLGPAAGVAGASLAGLLAALLAGAPDEGPVGDGEAQQGAARRLAGRTTALAATLLELAARGQVVEPAGRLLDLSPEGERAWPGALRRLERLGHGSGRAYALGIGSAAWLLAAGGGVG